MSAERDVGPAALVALGLALPLVTLYAASAFWLSGDSDVQRVFDELFDLDVRRVVIEWTSNQGGARSTVHPLQKLVVAPIGESLVSLGLTRLDAARWIAIVAMALNALLVGRLASQLAGGAGLAAAVATLLCGVSFSSVLLASVPDSASLSALASVLPLLVLNGRSGRDGSIGEAVVWGLLGVFCLAFTISQIVPWLIALTLRALDLGRSQRRLRPWTLWLVSLAVLVSVTWVGVNVQRQVYPLAVRFYDRTWWVQQELASYGRVEQLAAAPLRHTARLGAHFVGVNFVAPMPGYVPSGNTWSLSLQASAADRWLPAQRLLLAVFVAALLPTLVLVARASGRFVAPLLCVASQFGLHLVYGREFIMYSPNWHGLVVAIGVGAVWRTGPRMRGAVLGVAALLVLGMAANSLAVMQRVYAELDTGFARSLRDDRGAPLSGP